MIAIELNLGLIDVDPAIAVAGFFFVLDFPQQRLDDQVDEAIKVRRARIHARLLA